MNLNERLSKNGMVLLTVKEYEDLRRRARANELTSIADTTARLMGLDREDWRSVLILFCCIVFFPVGIFGDGRNRLRHTGKYVLMGVCDNCFWWSGDVPKTLRPNERKCYFGHNHPYRVFYNHMRRCTQKLPLKKGMKMSLRELEDRWFAKETLLNAVEFFE